MGNNQNVKKYVPSDGTSSNDCTVLILGAKSTGKTTLFKQILKYLQPSPYEYTSFFFEQFLLQIIHTTSKVVESSKYYFETPNIPEILNKLKKEPKLLLRYEYKSKLISLWEEKVMKITFSSKKGFESKEQDE
jgi:GTPase SAR1 family protein